MRLSPSTIMVVIICLVLGAAYFFFGRGEFNKRIAAAEANNAGLIENIEQIRLMESELPGLLNQLPIWRKQVDLFRKAIPEKISDEVFFSSINEQLKVHETKLLGVDVMLGGPWLGRLGEEQVEQLVEQGIDADLAQRIKVAFYSIRLLGQFDGVISAFEELKRYKRLYSIDEVAGPASIASGAVSAVVDPSMVPLQLSGRIYYDLPPENIDFAKVIRIFGRAKLRPVADAIKKRAQLLKQEPNGSHNGNTSTDGIVSENEANDGTGADKNVADNSDIPDEASSSAKKIAPNASMEVPIV